jgi:hypothetical protein
MKKSDSQLSKYDGFINFEELLKLIIKSKLFIAIVTLCFSFAVGFYSSLQPQVYYSELKVDLGIPQSPINNSQSPIDIDRSFSDNELKEIQSTLNFFWPSLDIEIFSPSFLKISSVGSKKSLEKVSGEVIDFFEKKENKMLENNQNRLAIQIEYLSKKRVNIETEINRLLNLEKMQLTHDFQKEVFMSQLVLKQSDIELEIDKIKNQSFVNKLNYEVIIGKQNIVNIYSNLLLSIIAGFILSVILLIIRLAAKDLKTN